MKGLPVSFSPLIFFFSILIIDLIFDELAGILNIFQHICEISGQLIIAN